MDLGLRAKGALVLAARRGLGRAVADRLSREGARVAITGRSMERLRRTAAEIEAGSGQPVVPVVADLRDPTAIAQMCDTAITTLGHIDILVLNSPGPPNGGFLDVTIDEWEQALELNLMSAVRTLYHVVPHMQARSTGRIIAITTVGIKQVLDDMVLSCSTRLALTGLLKTLSVELASDNILVNAVAPSRIMAGANKAAIKTAAERQAVSHDELEVRLADDVPLGRFGTPDEFADVVAFLASERAGYVTGVTLTVDGGRYRGML